MCTSTPRARGLSYDGRKITGTRDGLRFRGAATAGGDPGGRKTRKREPSGEDAKAVFGLKNPLVFSLRFSPGRFGNPNENRTAAPARGRVRTVLRRRLWNAIFRLFRQR